MQAYRWVIDSRDQYSKERLEKLSKDIKIEECQNIGMCTVTCPKGLNPQGAIQELLRMVRELEENKTEEELLWFWKLFKVKNEKYASVQVKKPKN